jgi:hypothetical protein
VFGLAKDALTEIVGTPLEHPPYSPDLASCDFWAQEVKTACSTIFLKLVANGLQRVFEMWVEGCKKCIVCHCKYFEKETVTAPPQSSVLSVFSLNQELCSSYCLLFLLLSSVPETVTALVHRFNCHLSLASASLTARCGIREITVI